MTFRMLTGQCSVGAHCLLAKIANICLDRNDEHVPKKNRIQSSIARHFNPVFGPSE